MGNTLAPIAGIFPIRLPGETPRRFAGPAQIRKIYKKEERLSRFAGGVKPS
jgi:hypothetical protein